MAIPTVPSVKAAAWRQPYKFSHRIGLWGLPLMLVAGAVTALVAGVGGYFGGAVTYWLVVQINRLAVPILIWLADETGMIGTGVGTALAFLPTLAIGLLYPALIGGLAGAGVMAGAQAGKCRMPVLAGFVGFLAGVAAVIALHTTAAYLNAPFQASSRVLQEANPGLRAVLGFVDVAIILWAATATVSRLYDNPYCEACGHWFQPAKSLTIPVSGADALVEALASRSATSLRDVRVGTTAEARIQVDMARCACGQSDYVLGATLFGTETKGGKSATKSNAWFNTTVPAALGAELEKWSTSTPAVMTAETTHAAAPEPRAPAARAVAPVVVAASASATDLCPKCGQRRNPANYTCPQCGYTQWGMVIGVLVFALIVLGAALAGGAAIASPGWRLVVMWGGGLLGGIVLLVAIGWVITGLRTPRKLPAAAAPTPAVAAAPAALAPAVLRAAPEPVPSAPSARPLESTWLTISAICERGDYDEAARVLADLYKRSNREFDADKKAYHTTCELIQEVGKQLNRQGGEALMKQVLTHAGASGCNTRFVEREWNGIGNWMG